MNNNALPSPEMYRPEFEDRYQVEYQQTISRAEGLVDKCSIGGEFREFPILAKTNATRKITKRFEETAPETVSHGKRRVVTSPYVNPLIFDRKDEMKFGTLESPIAPSIQNQRAEAARNMDSTIVGVSGEIGGLLGKAIQVNEQGVVSYPEFDDANRTIAANYAFGSTGGANIGMSYDKLLHLKTKLGKLTVISQDSSTNNPAALGLLMGYSQIEQLLQDEQIKNRDYASAKLEQVAEGKIVDLLGFSIKAMDDDVLPFDSENNLRTCVAFAKNAAKFGYNETPNHMLDRLPTKTHAIQSAFYWDWGLGRIMDEGVWKVPCLEE